MGKPMNWCVNCSVFGERCVFRVGAAYAFVEDIMIAHRRIWFYRLAGQKFAHAISFRIPVTAAKVRETLRKTVGTPQEVWGRSVY